MSSGGAEGRRRPISERAGRAIEIPKEARPREAAQFNGIVSEGPATALGEAVAARRPSGYNFFIFRHEPESRPKEPSRDRS